MFQYVQTKFFLRLRRRHYNDRFLRAIFSDFHYSDHCAVVNPARVLLTDVVYRPLGLFDLLCRDCSVYYSPRVNVVTPSSRAPPCVAFRSVFTASQMLYALPNVLQDSYRRSSVTDFLQTPIFAHKVAPNVYRRLSSHHLWSSSAGPSSNPSSFDRSMIPDHLEVQEQDPVQDS